MCPFITVENGILEELEKVAEIVDEQVIEPTVEIAEDIAKKNVEEVEFIGERTEKMGEKAIETVTNKQHYIYQEGQAVFKFAVKGMADVSAELLERNNLTGDDIAWLVPHQANKRIIDATAQRMGLSNDKVMLNIQKYGNTTAATIPLCLWEWEKQLNKGENLVLAAFGGGFTWGATLVKWAY